MRRLTIMGLAAAVVTLGLQMSMAAEASPILVQYDGPMMDGPGYGMPPGFDPDMGPGPGMEGGPYGPGPYGGGYGPRRRESRRSMGPFKTYHGFRIDVGEAQGRANVARALEDVEHQIDIVDRSGVSPSMLARFRAVPIRISESRGIHSHYSGGSEVVLGDLKSGDDRPILLHEYMHVLEYRTMPGRFHNPTIQHFFEEARARGLFPAEAYMMSNPAEFFAVTASCYLNGTVARDPYTRAAIRERQPDYYDYLMRLFGERLRSAEQTSPPRAMVATR
ncbi:MAG: hypothetical protein ACRYGP_14110 [Janthinobacterium lividum]